MGCDVIREIPMRKTLQFTGCVSGEIQSRRICRLMSDPDHFNLPSMAFIILSRPFPAGILMRITYVRAGSHLLHGGDAAEMLSELSMRDARAGALYSGNRASKSASLAFALARARVGGWEDSRRSREDAALRDEAEERKVLDWLPPKVRSG